MEDGGDDLARRKTEAHSLLESLTKSIVESLSKVLSRPASRAESRRGSLNTAHQQRRGSGGWGSPEQKRLSDGELFSQAEGQSIDYIQSRKRRDSSFLVNQLSPEQEEQLKRVFDLYDISGNGKMYRWSFHGKIKVHGFTMTI